MGVSVSNVRPHIFDHYNDEELAQRITYWESCGPKDADWGILEHMYALRDLRVDEKLLAWVESK